MPGLAATACAAAYAKRLELPITKVSKVYFTFKLLGNCSSKEPAEHSCRYIRAVLPAVPVPELLFLQAAGQEQAVLPLEPAFVPALP